MVLNPSIFKWSRISYSDCLEEIMTATKLGTQLMVLISTVQHLSSRIPGIHVGPYETNITMRNCSIDGPRNNTYYNSCLLTWGNIDSDLFSSSDCSRTLTLMTVLLLTHQTSFKK
jgi:hypothetical protein